MKPDDFYKISANDIRHNLLDVGQIVFEVTDACNLKCKYCAYGEFYNGYDERESKYMPTEYARNLIDYLVNLWTQEPALSHNPQTFVSFYGGEPLLNMPFIQDTVHYIENLVEVNRAFRFSMTTNGVLLDHYMDYLVEKDFNLLISLDGDEAGQSYRVDKVGNNSFMQVFNPIRTLQARYPHYFDKRVRFNAVLHRHNSTEGLYVFFKKHFNKIPTISELSESQIRPEKKKEFAEAYRNMAADIKKSEKSEELTDRLFERVPDIRALIDFVNRYGGNTFDSYNALLNSRSTVPLHPTGTCLPFARKIFVSVNGKILQCERIGHNFALGSVTGQGVVLDYDDIVDRFNGYIRKFYAQCHTCYARNNCSQCIYHVDKLENENPVCPGFMNKENFLNYYHYNIGYLGTHPHLYQKIMEDIRIG